LKGRTIGQRRFPRKRAGPALFLKVISSLRRPAVLARWYRRHTCSDLYRGPASKGDGVSAAFEARRSRGPIA